MFSQRFKHKFRRTVTVQNQNPPVNLNAKTNQTVRRRENVIFKSKKKRIVLGKATSN